jgi:hypothetical protein
VSDEALEEAYREFQADLKFETLARGDSVEAAFFGVYASLASENGDCIDLTYTPARKEGRGGYRIDGYALEIERGILHVAICDYRDDGLETLNAARIDSLLAQSRRFIELAVEPGFIDQFEPSDPEFEAGFQLSRDAESIRRIRLILFSNAHLSTRRQPEAANEIAGRPVVYNFLDFRRYSDILRSRSSPEPIEVDLVALHGSPVPCLPAYNSADEYESYLLALPGTLLADIYGLYGARLLEQNVRTFLQAKTKVNRAMIATLREAPEMFLAYNNGLTATASRIRRGVSSDGSPAIEMIEDLQIVNGGQTTASILYARDRAGSDLTNVYVQMKLSVVKPELVEEIVPKISRYANSQNKVSDADFFASHKFHVCPWAIPRREGIWHGGRASTLRGRVSPRPGYRQDRSCEVRDDL